MPIMPNNKMSIGKVRSGTPMSGLRIGIADTRHRRLNAANTFETSHPKLQKRSGTLRHLKRSDGHERNMQRSSRWDIIRLKRQSVTLRELCMRFAKTLVCGSTMFPKELLLRAVTSQMS